MNLLNALGRMEVADVAHAPFPSWHSSSFAEVARRLLSSARFTRLDSLKLK